jgi:hypothetical protein
MIDTTLYKDLTEIFGNNLTSPEIDIIGAYFFKHYSTHTLEGLSRTITVSPHRAAKRLVEECIGAKKEVDLITFAIELDGTSLNGRTVKLSELDRFLYRLSRSGHYFDFNRRKLIQTDRSPHLANNWGVLREGREYPMFVASIDIHENSKLVKKYKTSIIEREYHNLLEFITRKLHEHDGRTWHWAGDGGILAFRDEEGPSAAVTCCLEILFSLSIYNCMPRKAVEEHISLRIGMDAGRIKFMNNTGRIISDVINFASHLEKEKTEPNGLSISREIHERLSVPLQSLFKKKLEFEGRTVHSLVFNCEKAFG